MKKFSANYSFSNHNFVIQNLDGNRINNEYLAPICILKNILQRGKPTILSSFLQNKFGKLHLRDDFYKAYPLIDKKRPNWGRIIRGDDKGNYFPAKKFYDELIPKYFPDYEFLQQLIIPEIPVNEITQVTVDEFADQQVDFYLPQAYLIIEIDGFQHERDREKDRLRDFHTSKFGIQTVRIKTSDLETENETFLQKIQDIKNRIEKVNESQIKRKNSDRTFKSIADYQSAYMNDFDMGNPNYISTAVIRFQLLILELLEFGKLSFKQPWSIELIEHDISNFAEIAIEDLLLWFKHIFKLHKIAFNPPQVFILKCHSISDLSDNKDSIKVDFSILKRYTDEFQIHSEMIFVRTDYLDEYLYFKKGDSRDKLVFSSFEQYDYFSISTTETIKYDLRFGDEDSDEKSLLFLIWNIFFQNIDSLDFETLKFREGQLSIISNALSKNDTIGLLPTGSGKSVCYQLAAILQPAISFVVCPIKSLMYDQKSDLDSVLFTRVNHITSSDDGEDKEKIQNEFGKGKYFFILISPERFQLKTFRHYFSSVNKKYHIAYAVIDEVHCLSEWGHDFRTSYLNLSNTIKRLCTHFNFIGLTATASINVLKDIQIEFGIKQENVKTPADYTRKELEFIVIDDNNNKFNALTDQLETLIDNSEILEVDGNDTKCGIIFTPTVNGDKGCYPLSLKLSEYFHKEIRYFSGSVPKIDKKAIMPDIQFEKYKEEVQKDFKNNKFSLITATKAFGMGINKGNIHYTFHYGIPASMESLYQEAGRAGRDSAKFTDQKAQCYVLLSKSNNEDLLDQIWRQDTTLSQINMLQKKIDGDINTILFLFSLGLDVIKDEFKVIQKIHTKFSSPGMKNVKIQGTDIDSNKAKTEKAIYRLNQLGIIEDWTISNFFKGGAFEVDYTNFSELTIKNCLINTINKYDKEFSFEEIMTNENYLIYKKILNAPDGYSETDKYVLILLQWSYDNFVYNRRKSLKDIYELCCAYDHSEKGKNAFKVSLEAYFKFTQKSYIFDHIAENPRNFRKWFEVFYQIEDYIVTDKFITRREQENLKDNLNRFLQSYMHNTGLDLISGLLRLLLDDYNNMDGRVRFESSFEKIQHFDLNDREYIIEQTLKIAQEMNLKNKNNLAESLYKFFGNYEFLLRISKTLNDQFSMLILIEQANVRLLTINERIYGRLGEVR